MKTILGLRKPVSGSVTTSDGLKPDEIGYMPQQTVVQRDFPASVSEIVMSGFIGKLGRRPFFTAEQRRLAYSNMERAWRK